jgi:hypothetical protein
MQEKGENGFVEGATTVKHFVYGSGSGGVNRASMFEGINRILNELCSAVSQSHTRRPATFTHGVLFIHRRSLSVGQQVSSSKHTARSSGFWCVDTVKMTIGRRISACSSLIFTCYTAWSSTRAFVFSVLACGASPCAPGAPRSIAPQNGRSSVTRHDVIAWKVGALIVFFRFCTSETKGKSLERSMNVSAGCDGLVDWRLQPLLFEPFGNSIHQALMEISSSLQHR